MLKTKQCTIAYPKYTLLAIIFLLFVLFLSQKSNLITTIVGVPSTLLLFYIVLTVKDFTYKKRLFDSTQLSHHDNENGAFAKFDKNFNITYVSKAFIQMLGIEEGNLLEMLKNCALDEKTAKRVQQAVKNNQIFNDMLELNIINQTLFLDTFIYKVAKQHITKAEYIIRCNDITSYIMTESELKNQLFTDPYTQLPTRLRLIDDLKESAKQKKTHAQTLLYIQIDAYEEIHEFFGIDIGHKLLRDVSAWLQKNLPTKNSKVYKFDHNNFAIHTTSRISIADLEKYLRYINTKLQNENFLIQETYHDISFTIGVARGNKNLLKHAYLALKEAQRTNKSYKIFNKNNHHEEKYLQNLKTNKNIKKALLDDRIVPFFQPILNIKTNEVEKFESLIRIQNKDNSYQKPAEFLELSKQSKLYPELTKAMITGSLKRLEFLQQPITINISIDDITNSRIANFILRKLQRHPFAHMVTFEILETHEILNYTKVSNFIKKIKALNCSVAIDDFGSGYSNFEQVLKLDIDYIKIDGSLIKNIDTNRENEIVTKTIIAFAKELGVKTIAEFVSNEAIFDKVKSLGIDYAQGYYIGKPAPINVRS